MGSHDSQLTSSGEDTDKILKIDLPPHHSIHYSVANERLQVCRIGDCKLAQLDPALCPLCGQSIPPHQFEYASRAYFELLANIHPSMSPREPALSEKPLVSSCSLPPGLLNQGYYDRFFEEIHQVGQGSFGYVFYCRHVLDSMALGNFAVKKIPVGNDRSWLRKVIREVKCAERLHHANICEYKHSWLEFYKGFKEAPSVPFLFVLMEYCNGGSLQDFIFDHTPTSPQEDQDVPERIRKKRAKYFQTIEKPPHILDDLLILKLFYEVCLGLEHLHGQGILHMDLKCANIMLKYEANRNDNSQADGLPSAVLCDFGTACLFDSTESAKVEVFCSGTIAYSAPERVSFPKRKFGEEMGEYADLWSLGIVLYVMSYSHLPYWDEDPDRLKNLILTHDMMGFPQNPERPGVFKDIIHMLTNTVSNERGHISEIVDYLNESEVVKHFTNSSKEEDLATFFRKQRRSPGGNSNSTPTPLGSPPSPGRRSPTGTRAILGCPNRLALLDFGKTSEG